MNTDLMFSSETDQWSTPQEYFDDISKEFTFTTDVCASAENAKVLHYFTRADNGLIQDWNGVCWMNPPYGRVIGKWVKKAYESSMGGATVVGLLPARTDTKWFHEYIYGKSEIRFIKGRLRFGGCKNPAPFLSMLVIWKKEAQQVIQPDAEIIKGVIKGMRVSNKDVKNISALCQKVSGKDHCGGCKYDDDKYDYCPETWYASSLAADLLEARELIKELTNGFEIVRDNTLNPAHSMTVLGLEETTDANHKLALALLEKTKEYAE